MKTRTFIAWVVPAAMLAASQAAQSVYKPVPPGFDFPADEKALLQLRDKGDVAGMRKHAWMVFAGLTQPARPGEAGSEAVWETWYFGEDVFGPAGPAPQSLQKRTRQFAPLRQAQSADGLSLQSVGQSVASFTLFNEDTRQHIRANRYQMRATMDALNSSWPSATKPKDRKIVDFPRPAMSLKTTWWVVKKNTPTGMYIWDEKPQEKLAPAQPASEWKRAVVIDPTRKQVPAGERRTIHLLGKAFPESRVVPLDAFYHFAVTSADVATLNQVGVGAGEDPNLGSVEVGDFLVLAALHYTTKEIPDWVWATFWWHDKPDEAPFGEGRVSEIKGVWRNYKMDVAFDMTLPRETDNTPNAVFNPWLEARFPNGVNSNCMTCHQLAVWERENFPVTRGPLADDNARFKSTTKTDFMWSIIFEGGR